MISDDPSVCLFDSADGTLCTYRDSCQQRTGKTPCLGMAEAEATWNALPPELKARYTSKST